MQTYTPVSLGSNRTKTPEGFLLCKNVRLARTGELLYGHGQTPVKPGPDGVARVTRDADVLFAQETLDSFVGKSVTYRHPPKGVDVTSWRTVEAGVILSPRRGSGAESEYMLGDLLIKDSETIDVLDSGARCDVSNGYVARYADDGNGRGRQTKITGNHVAILPPGVRGRCGSECFVADSDETDCYVADQAMDIEEKPMTKTLFGLAGMRKLLAAKDETEAQATLDQMTADAHAAEIADKDAEIARLTGQVSQLTADLAAAKAEPETPARTVDAAVVTALHPRIVAAAEILLPGATVPTIDSADMVATADQLAACQLSTLQAAHKTEKGRLVIEAVSPDFDPTHMTADQISAAFFGAAALAGQGNNAALAAIINSGSSAVSVYQTNLERSNAAQDAADKRWGRGKYAQKH